MRGSRSPRPGRCGTSPGGDHGFGQGRGAQSHAWGGCFSALEAFTPHKRKAGRKGDSCGIPASLHLLSTLCDFGRVSQLLCARRLGCTVECRPSGGQEGKG